MKLNTHITIIGLMVGFVYLLFIQWSDSTFKDLNSYSPKAIGDINTKFKKDLNNFLASTITFNEAVEYFANNKNGSERDILKSYRTLRTNFKKVEFIIEYLDKEAYDKTINGAPLPKLEKKVADVTILEPHGFQVIDEIIGSLSINNKDQKALLQKEVNILTKSIKKIHTYLKVRKFSDRQFFEATRQGIIRLATLGITGFDTPGTLQGIKDADLVLKTFNIYIDFYKPELKNIDNDTLLKISNSIFKKGLKFTRRSNFDNFNRLAFIKEVINPIYKNIKDIHLALGYETIDEVSRYIQAVNYDAENLFESDFLNQFYYVSLEKDSTYSNKVKLGKLLFYDPILSKDNNMSCVTCHDPNKAFTDGKTVSFSNKGTNLERNAMTLTYSVYATRFFHDLRAKRLEDQFEHVVVSTEEFNTTYKEILEKINESDHYAALFKEAFPNSNQIKSNDIDYALAAYVMKLNTFDSTIDQYFQNHISNLPKTVERGFNLFTGKAACATCHFSPLFSGNLPPLFIDTEAEVLGVPEQKEQPWTLDNDIGRVKNGVTQDVAYFYEGSFKTPTIRNISLTAPYMHNGVFNTLEEVMNFYNLGGGVGGGIELKHQTLAGEPLNLTEDEITDIIAFMKALNDTKVFERPKDIPRDFSSKNINERKF